MDSKPVYQKRIRKFDSLAERQLKAANILSNLRLLVFIGGAGISVFLGIVGYYYLLAASIIATLVFFILLVVKHNGILNRMNYSKCLSKINNDSIKRITNEWSDFSDDGKEFMDENHDYSNDLDIFAKSSLFQWINTAITFYGRRRLAAMLTETPESCKNIEMRQDAIKELTSKLNWRQRLQAEGLMVKGRMKDPKFIIEWAADINDFYCKSWVIALLRTLPIVSLLLLSIGLVFSLLPVCIAAAFLFLLQYVLLKVKGKEHRSILEVAEMYHEELKVYQRMLELLCNRKYESALLVRLIDTLKVKNGDTAYKQMQKLSKIVDSISNRHTPFYFIFNILLLWDYQNLIALEKWKKASGSRVGVWLETIGEFEAFSSLAIIGYDNPLWAIPVVTEDGIGFKAEEMGHPLLKNSRICNDFSLQLPTRAILVTGSNMSGKSTFLRTVGINLVLAYMGAPVCAKSFSVILSSIHSCMRVNDSLEKGISSFYSELIRIKKIVEAANSDKKVFFLLDEIFKGTNSIDRHTGARVLIKKLCETKAFGLVSTHDLELCLLEKESPKIKNYHFQEFYEEGKICFDYKLRQGASTTRNAVYLMKMAGIDVEE